LSTDSRFCSRLLSCVGTLPEVRIGVMGDAELHDFWCPKCKLYESSIAKETRHIGTEAEPLIHRTSYNCCVCNAKGDFPSSAKASILDNLPWSVGMACLWLLIWFEELDFSVHGLCIAGLCLSVGLIWFAVACYSEVLFLIRWKLWKLRSGNR